MNCKGLCIFDWNGTIQDDMHHIYECGVERIFRHFDLPCPTLDQFRNEVTPDFMIFYRDHGIPADATAAQLNEIMGEGFKAKGVLPGIFPDAVGAVAALHERGYELMVASAYHGAKLVAAVHREGFAPFFRTVIGDVRDKAKVLGDLVAESSCPRGPVAVIGDQVEDAYAARAIGATAYLCPRGFHSRDRLEAARLDMPHIVIVDTLERLLQHFP